jgi:hypothetical protein
LVTSREQERHKDGRRPPLSLPRLRRSLPVAFSSRQERARKSDGSTRDEAP